MGIPAGDEPPVQTVQNQPRPAGEGQPLPPLVGPGVDLNFDAPVVDGIGGGSGHRNPILQGDYPQPPADKVVPVPEVAAQVLGPRLSHKNGVVLRQDRGEGVPLRQGGGVCGQPLPVKRLRPFHGIAGKGR